MFLLPLILSALAATGSPGDAPRADVVVEDFEAGDFGPWRVEGTAFGAGPVSGEMRGQGPPSGYLGRGWANSFHGGPPATGRLTSPPFALKRPYLNFLIGGGRDADKLGVRLRVDGEVVRAATGPNDPTGKIQRLDWASWDVSPWMGRQAVFEIVDQADSGPAHILVDQIIQSDRDFSKQKAVRRLHVTKPWLHLPVKLGERQTLLRFYEGDTLLREFEVSLAPGKPDFWAFEDMRPFLGRDILVEADWLPQDGPGLEVLAPADDVPDAAGLYAEAYRPRFHFTARRGRMLDPNGLVYDDGVYHMFFQHFAYALHRTAIRSWGHAVSRDLVHWTERPDAIYTDELGTIYSGCAVVDHADTAGLQTGRDKVIACFYTSASGGNPASRGRLTTQSMAYSADGGRTWTKYAANPVVPNIHGGNRNPKVIWHEPTGQWIMALFLKNDGTYLLLASKDLTNWSQLSTLKLPGVIENPDLFQLPVDGDAARPRWVFSANGNYYVGAFDGKAFHPEGELQSSPWDSTYAEQTFSDLPDGRRVQMAYIQGGRFPGMPFNTQMTVPRELSLRTTPEGVRLFIEPVRELDALRRQARSWQERALAPGTPSLDGAEIADTADLEVDLEVGSAKTLTLAVRGAAITYRVADQVLEAGGREAPLKPVDGRLHLRVLLDRTSVEVFAHHGAVNLAWGYVAPDDDHTLSLAAEGGEARLISLRLWDMASIWEPAPAANPTDPS